MLNAMKKEKKEKRDKSPFICTVLYKHRKSSPHNNGVYLVWC